MQFIGLAMGLFMAVSIDLSVRPSEAARGGWQCSTMQHPACDMYS